jgi:hypothetical protein
MTSFQKIVGGLFLAARAGRGGALVLLPFILVIMAAFWLLGSLGSLGNLLVRGVTTLASNAVAAKAGQRGL